MTSQYDPNHVPTIFNFKVGQKIVVFNQNSEVLLMRRSVNCSRAGGWDFPGGSLEDEEPLAGIERETKEEAGISISNLHPVSIVTHGGEDKNSRTLMIGYTADVDSDQQITLSWEHDQYQWLSIDQALEIDLPNVHQAFLQAAIEFRRVKEV
jgi:8-oxo-dGTP diphosphatase